ETSTGRPPGEEGVEQVAADVLFEAGAVVADGDARHASTVVMVQSALETSGDLDFAAWLEYLERVFADSPQSDEQEPAIRSQHHAPLRDRDVQAHAALLATRFQL